MQRTAAIILINLTLLASCTYRFTNKHVKRPANIKTIAVEAIYDTTRTVIPHEILWDELQKAFVSNGKLRLVPVSSADALVRAHIISASRNTGRIESTDEQVLDPEIKNPEEAAHTDLYKNFKKLTQAGEYSLEDNFRYATRIEVIDLRSRNVLLNKKYSGNRILKTSRGGNEAVGFYLIYSEAIENQFRAISRNIAQQVVEDLLISY